MSGASRNRTTVPITLGLSGQSRAAGVPEGPSAKKFESNNGSVRIVVTTSSVVDAEQANLIVALFFEEMHKISGKTRVERVKLSNLQFTREGANSVKGFLSTHAASITHVSLKGIVRDSSTREEEAVFEILAQAFEDSTLETLNLSDNLIGSYMWKNWASQRGLRQLLLDQVEMDEKSIVELAYNMTYAECLEDLYVVLVKPATEIAVLTLSDVLASCSSLTSLRWVNSTPNSQSKLLWSGLRQMVDSQPSSALRHLVMDGGLISVSELSDDGLCGALRQLPQLRTLKLRDVGLRDNGVRSIMTTFKFSQPPLEWLDLSGNMIELEGAKAIAQMVKIGTIVSNLQVLVLERNEIDTVGGAILIEAFAPVVSEDFDIRLDMNPMNHTKIAMQMARANIPAKDKLEGTRIQSADDCEHSVISRGSDSSTIMDVHMLQDQCQKLKNEKDVLVQAFSLLGVGREVDERKQLLERISKLEAMAQGSDHSKAMTPGSDHSNGRINPAQRNRRPVSRGYPPHFDTPTSTTSTMPLELSTPNSRVSRGSNESVSSGEKSDRMKSGKQRGKNLVSPAGSRSSTKHHGHVARPPLQPSLPEDSDSESSPETASPGGRTVTRNRSGGRSEPQDENTNGKLVQRNKNIRINTSCNTNMVVVDRLGLKHKEQDSKTNAPSTKTREENKRCLKRLKSRRLLVDKLATEGEDEFSD